MKAKAGHSSNILAIEQWLKKKPRDHFARRVTAPEAFPEPVKQLLLGALQPEEYLCWLVDVPPQGMYHPQRAGSWLRKIWQLWELTLERVAALTDHRLLLISIPSGNLPPQLTAIPAENILYLEHGMLLLFSWLRITWGENQMPREEVIYFDSVDEAIFMPLICMLRRLTARRDFLGRSKTFAAPVDARRWDEEQTLVAQCNREALKDLPLKFLNLVPLYGLLQDEHICQVLYRPSQWRMQFGLKRVMTALQLVVLRTDAYLLLAAEDLSCTTGSYGLTLTFLPCKSVQAVSTSRNGKQCNLHISLETQNTARNWSLPFPLEMDEVVRDFARSCMETRLAS